MEKAFANVDFNKFNMIGLIFSLHRIYNQNNHRISYIYQFRIEHNQVIPAIHDR